MFWPVIDVSREEKHFLDRTIRSCADIRCQRMKNSDPVFDHYNSIILIDVFQNKTRHI